MLSIYAVITFKIMRSSPSTTTSVWTRPTPPTNSRRTGTLQEELGAKKRSLPREIRLVCEPGLGVWGGSIFLKLKPDCEFYEKLTDFDCLKFVCDALR